VCLSVSPAAAVRPPRAADLPSPRLASQIQATGKRHRLAADPALAVRTQRDHACRPPMVALLAMPCLRLFPDNAQSVTRNPRE